MNAPIQLLYAEDNPQDADLTRSRFAPETAGFQLEIVDTGSQCLARLAAGAFDLLLLDNHLPDMDGLEVLAKLRALGFTLPVVMVTGAGNDELVAQALRAGAADYVAKAGGYLATLPDLLRGLLARRRRHTGETGPPPVRQILYVEPNPMDAELTVNHFATAAPHLKLHVVPNCLEALVRLGTGQAFDLVLTDLRVPEMNALEFLHESRRRGIELPFIVITGRGDETTAVTLLRLGASDYLVKRENYLTQLPHAIDHALHRALLDQATQRMHGELAALNQSLEERVALRTVELSREIAERQRAEESVRELLATAEKSRRSLLGVLEDQQRAEAALREAEARLRLCVAASNIGLWDWNLVTSEVYFSPEWKSQLGYADDEIPNRFEEWESRLHPDDLAPTVAKVRHFIEDPAAEYAVEFRLRHKDGSWRWIFTQAQIFRDAAGKPMRMMGCHIDITGRKEAEEAMQASEQRLRSILDTMFVFVGLMDLDGRIVEVNEAPLAVAGLKREDVLGRTIPESYWFSHSPSVQEQVREAMARVARGKVARADYPIRIAGGQLITIDCTLAPLRDASGQVAQIVGSAVDITGRKQAEEALRDLTARLLHAQDEERRRIAKELHDSTAQDLVAVMMNLEMLRDSLPPLGVESAQILEDSVALVENSANDIRTLSYVLHPPRLEETGLPGGLTEYAAGLGKRADLRIRVEAAPDFGRLPEGLEIVLFRVAQEALGNVVRHSGSDAATVRLARTDEGVVLEIQDYGRGMPPGETMQRGVGIAGMRERVQHLGGRLEIRWSDDGTTVRAVLPLKGETK